jgi:DNA-directed RNA polymerase alpha subunit
LPTNQIPDDTPLDHVDLPRRLRNALADEGINTAGAVRDLSDANLSSFHSIAGVSIRLLRKNFGPSRV